MKTYIFPYYVSGGPGDTADAEVECTLDDDMAARLEASARQTSRFHLSEDEEIDDIWQTVYAAVLEQERRTARENPEIVLDALSWEEDIEEDEDEVSEEQIDRYLEELDIGINYPRELQG